MPTNQKLKIRTVAKWSLLLSLWWQTVVWPNIFSKYFYVTCQYKCYKEWEKVQTATGDLIIWMLRSCAGALLLNVLIPMLSVRSQPIKWPDLNKRLNKSMNLKEAEKSPAHDCFVFFFYPAPKLSIICWRSSRVAFGSLSHHCFKWVQWSKTVFPNLVTMIKEDFTQKWNFCQFDPHVIPSS